MILGGFLGREDRIKKQEFEKCKKAVEVYSRALSEQRGVPERGTSDEEISYLQQDGAEGLRLGSPRSLDAKLKYTHGRFWVSQADMDDEVFKEWDEFVGQKFEDAGLKWRYSSRDEEE